MNEIKTIGFVGGGRVTRFLIEGWRRANKMPSTVRVADCNAGVLDALTRDFSSIAAAPTAVAAACDLVVLAVHPPVMKEVMAEVKPCLKADATVLSLAPKFTAAAIADALAATRVARMIPNAPSAIGKGFNPVAYTNLDGPAKAALNALFAPWGEAPEVPERDLEAYAMVSAMGPTYMWFQWQALRELATSFGLDTVAADRAIFLMIEGAAECLLASGREPTAVMDMIPVKPLKDDEPALVAAYRAKLTGLYDKIKA